MTATRVLLGLLVLTLASAPALAGYTAGGTFVVKSGDDTLLDNGGAICRGLTGSGVGGGCLPFSRDERGAFIGVADGAAGREVAFQVCIDNNGDGVCGGPTQPDSTGEASCQDQIFFSHADGGKFFNPLGPLPTSSLRGCPKAFQGYVVLLCQGEHVDAAGPHTHRVTEGTIALAPFGSGYGDFCGGGFGGGTPAGFVNAAAKAYRVV